MKIYKFLAMLLLVAGVGLSFVSCSDDDDEDANAITVVNNSSYSLNRLTIHFLNARTSDNGEELSQQDFGTVNPSGSISAPIPAGATYYYIAIYEQGEYWFSADYSVSVTRMSIDNNTKWYTND